MLNLIDHLPRDSALVEAMAGDDGLAEQLAAQPESSERVARRMSDWSAEVELLTAVLDRIGELVQAVVASAGAKPRKVTPAPRPVTAIERARRRRRESQHQSLVARVLPARTPNPPTT